MYLSIPSMTSISAKIPQAIFPSKDLMTIGVAMNFSYFSWRGLKPEAPKIADIEELIEWGFPLPSWLESLGERHKLPSGVRDKAPGFCCIWSWLRQIWYFWHFCDTYLVTYTCTITKRKTSCIYVPYYALKTVVKIVHSLWWPRPPRPSGYSYVDDRLLLFGWVNPLRSRVNKVVPRPFFRSSF